MAQKKETRETKQTKKKIKMRDLKSKKDPKGGAYNGNRQGYTRPPGSP